MSPRTQQRTGPFDARGGSGAAHRRRTLGGVPEEPEPLPPVVWVMAEHQGTGLWDRDHERYGDVDADDLGLSAGLTARLGDWVRRFEEHAGRWDWGPPPRTQRAADEAEWAAWRREGLALAFAVQDELDALGHDVEVIYEDDDLRPVRQRRGT